MPVIKDKVDWWYHYNANLGDLINLVVNYTDREYIKDLKAEDIVQQMRDWGEEEEFSETLFSYLNSSWFFAPEETCRSLPGWFVLCDLCSEYWVFEDEMVEEEA